MQKVILGVIALIVIAVIAVVVLKKDSDMPSGGDMEGERQDTSTLPPQPELAFGESFAGRAVTVARAYLETPGYIAVYRTTSEGEAYVAGYTELLDSGMQTNVLVVLDEEVTQGDTIAAAIHNDDGDGVFEFPGDDAAAEADGAIVVALEAIDIPTPADDEALMASVLSYLRGFIGPPEGTSGVLGASTDTSVETEEVDIAEEEMVEETTTDE